MKNIEVGAQLMAVAVAGGLLFSGGAQAHPLSGTVAQTTLAADWDDSRRDEQINEERQRRYYEEQQRARDQYDRDQRERQRQDEDRRRYNEQQQRYYNN